jgi:hypothetical protein
MEKGKESQDVKALPPGTYLLLFIIMPKQQVILVQLA